MKFLVRGGLLVVAVALLGGCASVIGPGSVVKDRVDYSSSVADSWMRMVLLNIVKIRYVAPPVYMDVSSIVSGNSLETSLSLGVSIPDSGTGPNIFSPGGAEKYTDRPTITYTPLTGSKFVKSLLTPIPPQELFSTVQSGWSADAMLYAGVASINGLHNNQTSIAGETPGDEQFFRFLELMEKVQAAGALSLHTAAAAGIDKGAESGPVLVFEAEKSERLSAATREEIRKIKEILRLNPNMNRFRLVYGSHAVDDSVIAVQTRSLVQILGVMAAEMDVPPEHVADGRTAPSPKAGSKSLIRIHCSTWCPGDALVAVPYKHHWYWIDDRDIPSKRAFNFVMILFALAETGELHLPLITIPAQSS